MKNNETQITTQKNHQFSMTNVEKLKPQRGTIETMQNQEQPFKHNEKP